MCSFSDSEGPRFALLRFTPIDRRGSKDRKIAAFFRKGEVRSHHRGITDNRAVRALDRGQGRGWGEDATLLTVLFQSFARFSTPTGGQPLDSAGETRGGHRDKTSGNWRNSAVILPVMFYPPHTYTLSRPFVGARRPPLPSLSLCLCVRARFPPLLLSPNVPALSAAFYIRGREGGGAVCAPLHVDDVVKS